MVDQQLLEQQGLECCQLLCALPAPGRFQKLTVKQASSGGAHAPPPPVPEEPTAMDDEAMSPAPAVLKTKIRAAAKPKVCVQRPSLVGVPVSHATQSLHSVLRLLGVFLCSLSPCEDYCSPMGWPWDAVFAAAGGNSSRAAPKGGRCRGSQAQATQQEGKCFNKQLAAARLLAVERWVIEAVFMAELSIWVLPASASLCCSYVCTSMFCSLVCAGSELRV